MQRDPFLTDTDSYVDPAAVLFDDPEALAVEDDADAVALGLGYAPDDHRRYGAGQVVGGSCWRLPRADVVDLDPDDWAGLTWEEAA